MLVFATELPIIKLQISNGKENKSVGDGNVRFKARNLNRDARAERDGQKRQKEKLRREIVERQFI